MNNSYTTIDKLQRHWALKDETIIGAVVINDLRTYVYPFCTPSGINVVQDAPPDHVHHTGIMVGQDFVNGHNFWSCGHLAYPRNKQKRETQKVEVDESGVTVRIGLRWVTEGGQSILTEERTLRFERWEDFNFVDVTSTWLASYGDIYVAPTKEGGMGMRVHPQLETFWGGTIHSSKGTAGEKDTFDRTADWMEVSGRAGGGDVGIVMMPHPSQKQIPWFVRDYGIHLYSPFRNASLRLAASESVQLRVGFAAYDGKSDGSQASEAWARYRTRP